jgi:hypothetical protein
MVAVPLDTDVGTVDVLVGVMSVVAIVLGPVPIDSSVDVVKVAVLVPRVITSVLD